MTPRQQSRSVVTLTLMLLLCFLGTRVPAQGLCPREDINSDGRVDVVDVQRLILELLSVEPPRHDLTGDGVVDVTDVQHLIQVVLGILAPLTCGLSWESLGPGGGSFLMSSAFHPSNPDIIYLGGDIEGPFKTTNGGVTWKGVSTGLALGDRPANVYASQALTVDPNQEERIYLGGWGGLFRSENGGGTWELIYPESLSAEPVPAIACVVVDPANSHLVLAGVGDTETNKDGASRIVRSSDGGRSWQVVADQGNPFASPAAVVHRIVFDPLSPTSGRVAYAATSEGILKSQDGGLSWVVAGGAAIGSDATVHELIGVVHQSAFILFGVRRTSAVDSGFDGGVLRSIDGGTTWEDISGNLPREDESGTYGYWRMAVDPTNPERAFVGTHLAYAYEKMGLFGSTNALAPAENVTWSYLWENTGAPTFVDHGWLEPGWWNDLHVSFLEIAPSNPNIVIAGSDHIYKSTDGGKNWVQSYTDRTAPNAWAGRGLELMVSFAVTPDPRDPERIWVGYDDMGLWRTDDNGQSFIRLDPVQAAVALGETDNANSIVVDPALKDTVYVGRNGGMGEIGLGYTVGSVWKSVDGGASFAQLDPMLLSGGRPELLLLAGEGTPDTRTLLCAVYSKGLRRSTDSGATWVDVINGWDPAESGKIYTLAADPAAPLVVYAGVAAVEEIAPVPPGAVYRSVDGGRSWERLSGPSSPTGQVLDLAVAADGTVFAGTTDQFLFLQSGSGTRTGGLYRSRDRGATWARVLEQPRVEAVACRPEDPDVVLAASAPFYNYEPTQAAGVYVSRDGGEHFGLETRGLTHGWVLTLTFVPTRPDVIYAGTAGGGIFRSRLVSPRNTFHGTMSQQIP